MKRLTSLLLGLLVSLSAGASIIGETVKGTTDYEVQLVIIDSTDGARETGVVFNTAGIDLWYRRQGAAVVDITEATLAALTTAHTDGGFLHMDHGVYRLDLPDAAVAAGADFVTIGGTVTGMLVIGGTVKLTDVDMNDSVRAGMTALPNAAADAAGGLPVSDAGGLDLDGLNTNVNDIETDTGTTLPGILGTPANLGGGATLADNLSDIEGQTDDIGVAGAGLTESGGTGDQFTALNDISPAEVNTQVDNAIETYGLDHLVGAAVIGTDVIDNSIIARLASDDATADWDSYDNTSESFEALRLRGDAAWITGGAGSGTPTLADDTMQSGSTSTTAVLAASETFADDLLNERTYICINGGTGAGQCRNITDNVLSTDTVTVDEAWTTTPDNTSNYFIGSGTVNVALWSGDAASVQAGLETSTDFWANAERTLTAFDEDDMTIDLNATALGSLTGNVGGSVGSISGITFPTNFGSMTITAGGIVDATVQGILDTTFTESTAGRMAGNFETFYDNADAATTNVVDDVGAGAGGSFWTTTEQNQIRHRIGIDGTAGTPSATPSLATAAAQTTAQNDLDTITGSDGVTLATTQGNYAPATSAAVSGLNNLSQAEAETAAASALAAYDPPTRTELTDDVNSLPTASEIVTAVLAGQVEDQGTGYDLQCALATLLAYAAGDVSTSSGTSTYQDPSGTENRIVGTVSGANRSSITITCP